MGAAGGQPGNSESRVAQHYSAANVEERLLTALEASGTPREGLTAEQLSAVDEFHVGGREATVALAARMKVHAGMKLLDVGCGVGGPARYFALAHQCDVTGIDLTEDFVRAAQALTARVGPAEHVRFQQASALEMPFAAGSFDAAYLLHVGMNIADKKRLFAEIARVLRPGGTLAVFDFMRTGPEEFSFPVPWAGSESESFVASVEDYRSALSAAGFKITEERSLRDFGIEFLERMRKRVAESGGALGPQVLMGPDGPLKMRHVMESMVRNILAPVEILAKRV
jgi:ubiquinone/menaquinone biosynthesis C-methylase UbiE